MKKLILLICSVTVAAVLFSSCAGTATSTTIAISSNTQSAQTSAGTESDTGTTSSLTGTSSAGTNSLQAFGSTASDDISSLLAQASSENPPVSSYPRAVIKKVVTKTYSTVEVSSNAASQPNSSATVQSRPEAVESESEKVIKIMPIGEATTVGGSADSPFAYRDKLSSYYSLAKIKTQYIGTQNLSENMQYSGYADATAKSMAMQEINVITKCEAPDVILLMIGRNDLTAQVPVAEYMTSMNTILDRLVASYPNAHLFVAGVPEVRSADGSEKMHESDLEKEYAAALKSMVGNRANAGQKIMFVDMGAAATGLSWQSYTDQSAGYRVPNADGYTKIATALFSATFDIVEAIAK